MNYGKAYRVFKRARKLIIDSNGFLGCCAAISRAAKCSDCGHYQQLFLEITPHGGQPLTYYWWPLVPEYKPQRAEALFNAMVYCHERMHFWQRWFL